MCCPCSAAQQRAAQRMSERHHWHTWRYYLSRSNAQRAAAVSLATTISRIAQQRTAQRTYVWTPPNDDAHDQWTRRVTESTGSVKFSSCAVNKLAAYSPRVLPSRFSSRHRPQPPAAGSDLVAKRLQAALIDNGAGMLRGKPTLDFSSEVRGGPQISHSGQLFKYRYHKKVKVAHTRLPSVGSWADPGSWQSACRWHES